MSLFARSYNRFAGSSNSNSNSDSRAPTNDQNITYRKKLSAVSTNIHGDDAPVAASPRNCYSRVERAPSALRRQRVTDEIDGSGMSMERTPVELRAAEIRRMNSRKDDERPKKYQQEPTHHTPPPPPPPPPVQLESPAPPPPTTAVANPKKSRTSTTSLASVFRSRASSPIAGVRKFFGRSRSNNPKPKDVVQELPITDNNKEIEKAKENEKLLILELEKTRIQLSDARNQLAAYQQKDRIQKFHVASQSDQIPVFHVATMTSSESAAPESSKTTDDKENVTPEVICLDDVSRIRLLEQEINLLRKESAEKTDDFRRTRKDFILILKEAVLRKDEAERKLDGIVRNVSEEDDWTTLMAQHRHTLRRNVLLMWVQKKLEPFDIIVSNFSSDWTDCRAFCVLLSDLFPDLLPDPLLGDSVSRCRRAFQSLEIPFDERALGLSASPSATDSGAEDSSCSSYGLTDWRFVMNTVFLIYKRGVLGK